MCFWLLFALETFSTFTQEQLQPELFSKDSEQAVFVYVPVPKGIVGYMCGGGRGQVWIWVVP